MILRLCLKEDDGNRLSSSSDAGRKSASSFKPESTSSGLRAVGDLAGRSFVGLVREGFFATECLRENPALRNEVENPFLVASLSRHSEIATRVYPIQSCASPTMRVERSGIHAHGLVQSKDRALFEFGLPGAKKDQPRIGRVFFALVRTRAQWIS